MTETYKCNKCGDTNALLLFSSCICTNENCTNFDAKHAQEVGALKLKGAKKDKRDGFTGYSLMLGPGGAIGATAISIDLGDLSDMFSWSDSDVITLTGYTNDSFSYNTVTYTLPSYGSNTYYIGYR